MAVGTRDDEIRSKFLGSIENRTRDRTTGAFALLDFDLDVVLRKITCDIRTRLGAVRAAPDLCVDRQNARDLRRLEGRASHR